MCKTRADILAWWNSLSEQTRVDAAAAIGFTGDLEDITITQVVHIYNTDIVIDDVPVENADVLGEPVPGFMYINKKGDAEWTPDFEQSIGE